MKNHIVSLFILLSAASVNASVVKDATCEIGIAISREYFGLIIRTRSLLEKDLQKLIEKGYLPYQAENGVESELYLNWNIRSKEEWHGTTTTYSVFLYKDAGKRKILLGHGSGDSFASAMANLPSCRID